MVEKLVIDAQAPQQGALEAQRLEEMRETTDRMVADRMAREKHSAEVEKLQAETRADLAAQEFPGIRNVDLLPSDLPAYRPPG